jgi:anti-anti-sigma regulatory factor
MTQSTRIELDEQLTIAQAAALHRSLCASLDGGAPMVVDGSRIQEIDTAGLQLLASLLRSGQERGIACTWHGVSDVLRRTARLVGMSEMLRFPDEESQGSRGDVPV